MGGTSEHLVNSIRQYYVSSEKSYSGWGKDLERDGVYALHCGFHPEGVPIDQYESTKRMTREIVARANIKTGERALDAGCGSGAVLFELAESHLDAEAYGINIAANQLNSAARYAKSCGLSNINLSMQDYLRTAFTDSFFDKVIYSESLAHAEDKTALLNETKRILKNGGKLVIADAFLIHRDLNPDTAQLVEWAENGWVLP
ncbi:MAG: methyltransferase domain-containing protein, partial [Microgenomates group bacterium]